MMTLMKDFELFAAKIDGEIIQKKSVSKVKYIFELIQFHNDMYVLYVPHTYMVNESLTQRLFKVGKLLTSSIFCKGTTK